MLFRAFFPGGLRVVLAVASMHSLALGLLLSLYPNPFLEFMGLSPHADIFYPQQSGLFLIILGIGYGIGASDLDLHWGLVALAIISKGLAIVFLYYHVLALQAPRAIRRAAFGDTTFFLLLIFFAWGTYRQWERESQ